MKYVRWTITDTMAFWDDYLGIYVHNPANSKTFTAWYRVPDQWLENRTLVAERREQLLRHLYGSGWRLGNGDGSKYVVLAIDERELSDAEAAQRSWASTKGSCYAVSDDGTVESVNPDAM